jgi:hypothetical protein
MTVVIQVAETDDAKAQALLRKHSPENAEPKRAFVIPEEAVESLRQAGIDFVVLAADASQPISTDQEFRQEFQRLADQWREETRFLSVTKRMAEHPAYQKIIAMGPKVVPLILAEMERRPGHWFQALRELTGANPIPPESRGKLQEMVDAWIKWGREQGHQWESSENSHDAYPSRPLENRYGISSESSGNR